METVIIFGGTGYIGSRLIPMISNDTRRILVVVRPGSENKLTAPCEIIVADIFKPGIWLTKIPVGSTFIHLIGVSHPSPAKNHLYESIDLKSTEMITDIAIETKAVKILYLSVAMEPSGIMNKFQETKRKSEDSIKASGIPCVFIRPWYVLGPGHWWPYLLLPIYKILEWIPATRKKAKAFGLITIKQMLNCLKYVLDNPDPKLNIIEIEDIRKLSENEIKIKKRLPDTQTSSIHEMKIEN